MRILHFTTGPATVVDPSHINHINLPPGILKEVKTIKIDENNLLHLEGEFGNFKIYFLVTHTRAEIIPHSVTRIHENYFKATLKLELTNNKLSEHDVTFKCPLLPYTSVISFAPGILHDSFAFINHRGGKDIFQCDLTFMQNYAMDCPTIPLKIEYIGVAKAPSREAHERLGEGHEKLQKMLADQNKKQSRKTTSIILFRPSDLGDKDFIFSDVIETIEGTLIKYFKPTPLNIKGLNFPHDAPKLKGKIKGINVFKLITLLESPKGTSFYSDIIKENKIHKILTNIY